MKHILTTLAIFLTVAAAAQTGSRITIDLGRIGIDTALLVAGKPYVNNKLALKLNISDTNAMLQPYLRKVDTLRYAATLDGKLDTAAFTAALLDYVLRSQNNLSALNDVDTSGKGDGYYLIWDSASAKYVLEPFSGVFDIGSMPSGLRYTGGTFTPTDSSLPTKAYNDGRYATIASVAAKLNISDTAAMLAGYQRTGASSNFDLYTSRLGAWEYWNEWVAAPTATTSDGNGLVVNATGTGTGAGVAVPTATNRPGIIVLQTGSTATGRTSIYTNSGLNTVALGGATATIATDVTVPTLSTSTERFAFLVGLYDATTMNQTDGVYFLYDEGGVSTGSAASANWQCVTANNSSRTFTTTSTAVSSVAFQRLQIEVNAAGTSVDFKIDGTTVATHTTNIPTGTGARVMTYGYQIIKSVGTSGRTVQSDWFYIKLNFTTSR